MLAFIVISSPDCVKITKNSNISRNQGYFIDLILHENHEIEKNIAYILKVRCLESTNNKTF